MSINSIGNTPVSSVLDSVPQQVVSASKPAVAQQQATQQNSAVTQPSAAQLSQATKTINDKIQSINSDIEFSVDDKSGGVIVKVSDLKTKEVILQIPSREAIAISASLEKLQGLLVKLHA